MKRPQRSKRVEEALLAAESAVGEAHLLRALRRIAKQGRVERNTLTIIVNSGVHLLPKEYKRGRVFVASRGSLDFSSRESIQEEFRKVLLRTAKILKSHAWRTVYVVPFGPTALSMQIKLLVYRVCGLESIDVMHVAGQPRIDIDLDLRGLIVSAGVKE